MKIKFKYKKQPWDRDYKEWKENDKLMLDPNSSNKNMQEKDVENIGKDYIPVMHFSYLFSVKTFMLKEHKNHFVDFTSFVRITQ